MPFIHLAFLTITVPSYNLGFTAVGLWANHTFALASVYADVVDWKKAKEVAISRNVFQQSKESSSRRMEREFRLRLQTLTEEQFDLLITNPAEAKIPLALLAVFKRYRFIRDFCDDILRRKMGVFDYDVRPSDYLTFVEEKEDAHPELVKLSDMSAKKIQQRTFQILAEGGIISNGDTPRIKPSFLPAPVRAAILSDSDPSLIRAFLQP